jgi:hypothetical protein
MTAEVPTLPYRKTDRVMPRKPSPLAEPILIATWKKNRGADVIRVTLKNYEGFDLFDLRTWFNDREGQCRPGKGFTCGVRHIPQLAKAIDAALRKARELGLVDGGGE